MQTPNLSLSLSCSLSPPFPLSLSRSTVLCDRISIACLVSAERGKGGGNGQMCSKVVSLATDRLNRIGHRVAMVPRSSGSSRWGGVIGLTSNVWVKTNCGHAVCVWVCDECRSCSFRMLVFGCLCCVRS